MQQYAALVGHKVVNNLERMKGASVNKHARPYQTDAEIHQSCTAATSGASNGDDNEDAPDDGPIANIAWSCSCCTVCVQSRRDAGHC